MPSAAPKKRRTNSEQIIPSQSFNSVFKELIGADKFHFQRISKNDKSAIFQKIEKFTRYLIMNLINAIYGISIEYFPISQKQNSTPYLIFKLYLEQIGLRIPITDAKFVHRFKVFYKEETERKKHLLSRNSILKMICPDICKLPKDLILTLNFIAREFIENVFLKLSEKYPKSTVLTKEIFDNVLIAEEKYFRLPILGESIKNALLPKETKEKPPKPKKAKKRVSSPTTLDNFVHKLDRNSTLDFKFVTIAFDILKSLKKIKRTKSSVDNDWEIIKDFAKECQEYFNHNVVFSEDGMHVVKVITKLLKNNQITMELNENENNDAILEELEHMKNNLIKVEHERRPQRPANLIEISPDEIKKPRKEKSNRSIIIDAVRANTSVKKQILKNYVSAALTVLTKTKTRAPIILNGAADVTPTIANKIMRFAEKLQTFFEKKTIVPKDRRLAIKVLADYLDEVIDGNEEIDEQAFEELFRNTKELMDSFPKRKRNPKNQQ